MPSTLIGNQSGGQPLLPSGFFWSGLNRPVGSVLLKWDKAASGNLYVGLSGGMTINSGQTNSGAMYMDGYCLNPGDTYPIPKVNFGPSSGTVQVFLACDLAASGQGRLYWEAQ